jgi:hypothetical protein
LFAFSQHALAQSSESVFNSGKWIKTKVYHEGIYKLTYEYLKKQGIDKPEKIVVVGRGGAFDNMMNKKNIPNVNLMPLLCFDGGDGDFGKGDYFLFYAKGPENVVYDKTSGDFIYRKNQYEDFATYIIGYGNVNSNKIPLCDSPNVDSYIDIYDSDYFYIHEKSMRNLLKSGRNPVGEKFSSTVDYSFKINIPFINAAEKIKIKASLLARGTTDSDFNIIFNESSLGTLRCNKVNVASFSSPFADKKTFDAQAYGKENNHLKIMFRREGGNVGWLDYFTVHARRKLKLQEGYLLFSDSKTVGCNEWIRYNINYQSGIKVLDITNIGDEKEIKLKNNCAIVLADKFRRYIAFDPLYDFHSPELVGKVRNTDIHSISGVNMLIVTVDKLKDEAQRLADFHNEEGLITKVVLAEDIYNEFSSGQKHPIAIRDFVRNVYLKSSGKDLKYLCLFGDGSYDAKESLLPTWQTQNSLEPAYSFSSDDFFGLLDEGEGEALGDLDIGIGRIPVNTVSEAMVVVDKIISYKEEGKGNWITRLAFVADDGDYNEHVYNTDNIVEMIDTTNSAYRVEKVYMDAYPKVNDFNKQYYPDVNRELNKLINDGLLICNYIGHGNENGLAHEKILTEQDIEQWKNKEKMPLFITATCDFSRFDDHGKLSAGEKILLKKDGGAIALLTTTRIVYSSPNFILNKELFKKVLSKDQKGEHYRLGTLIKNTKNSIDLGDNMRNFSLIGDPALLLNYPEKEVRLLSETDTLKAWGKVKIEGEVCFDGGGRDEDFNGIVTIAVFDKKKEVQTMGNDSSPFKYMSRNNVVFNGSAIVRDGKFECEVPASADINKELGYGKILFYAYNDFSDASGYSDSLYIGGIYKYHDEDREGPVINMFMNNENFVYGGLTDSSPLLFAYLNDKNGINSGGHSNEHNIVATLDGEIQIVLNHNYMSDIDDFSRGTVWYRFSDLSDGKHSVTLDVWDNFNNHSTKEISFYVKNEGNSIVRSFLNYPNPSIEYTDFYFEHNMQDQEFTGVIKIYNLSGQLVKSIEIEGCDNGYRYGPFRWNLDKDNGGKVKRGIYIAELLLKYGKGKILKTSQKVVVTAY